MKEKGKEKDKEKIIMWLVYVVITTGLLFLVPHTPCIPNLSFSNSIVWLFLRSKGHGGGQGKQGRSTCVEHRSSRFPSTFSSNSIWFLFPPTWSGLWGSPESERHWGGACSWSCQWGFPAKPGYHKHSALYPPHLHPHHRLRLLVRALAARRGCLWLLSTTQGLLRFPPGWHLWLWWRLSPHIFSLSHRWEALWNQLRWSTDCTTEESSSLGTARDPPKIVTTVNSPTQSRPLSKMGAWVIVRRNPAQQGLLPKQSPVSSTVSQIIFR